MLTEQTIWLLKRGKQSKKNKVSNKIVKLALHFDVAEIWTNNTVERHVRL